MLWSARLSFFVKGCNHFKKTVGERNIYMLSSTKRLTMNVVAEIVGIVEEIMSDALFKEEYESVMLYDIETADFGFLHHVGEVTGFSPEGYLKNKISEFLLDDQKQVAQSEIRKHGTDLIKLLGGNEELLEQERKRSGVGKNAILNAIENLYGRYGESLDEPFFVKFLNDTLDVEYLSSIGSGRESFLKIREKLNDKEPWEKLRIYKGTGKKYFYYALRDFKSLGDVKRFFLKNDDATNNKFFEDAGFRVYPNDPDEYIKLIFKLFGEDEVLPGDLNQVIYFLRSRNEKNTPSADTLSRFKEKYEELRELFSLLVNRSDITIKVIKETKAKRRRSVHTNIPNLPDDKLKAKLIELLMSRKTTHKERFEQLVVLLKMLSEKQTDIVTQDMLRKEWKNRGLPKMDRGLSVSQVLGYEKWAALRQIIEWDIAYADVKDNYRLREERYAEIIRDVLMVVAEGIPHR